LRKPDKHYSWKRGFNHFQRFARWRTARMRSAPSSLFQFWKMLRFR
jgi:hypothetical protein